MKEEKVEGFYPIEILLAKKPEIVKKIIFPKNRNDDRASNIMSLAKNAGISIELSQSVKQNPIAFVAQQKERGLGELKEHIQRMDNLTLLVIDNISDPRNLGACIRSAVVAEVDGIIINKHQCSSITSTVRKVSCGATEIAEIFHVSNLINCIKYLNEQAIYVYGTSEHSQNNLFKENLTQSLAFVIGSEGKGIRSKTLDACNKIVSINANKIFNSLNVSVASGVLLFEAARQKNQQNA
tara:strand:+ start:188 stop:904 length:717 start_codon:yes stop_codon:yes gene_type:complete